MDALWGKEVRVGPIHALKNLKAVFLNQLSLITYMTFMHAHCL